MNSNVIFEGKHVIMDLDTFNYFKSIDRLNNEKADLTGNWFLLRNGFAYKVIIES